MKNIRNVFFMPRVKRQFEKAKAAHPELGNHINDLRNEIGYYLAAHKAAGIRFDSRHLEIIYSDGVTVVLRQGTVPKSAILPPCPGPQAGMENPMDFPPPAGIWIITRIVLTLPVKEYWPVFGFKRVREGAREAVRRVFSHWRCVFDTSQIALS